MARSQEDTPIGEFIRKAFPTESARVETGNCPFCGQLIVESDFRDQLSRKEFRISGLCQKCQDETFG